ncbi:MAG: division/cell wall cluster transcriptional repressor MraZ [Epulopiscium sp.]|nr:division/cell wall cluster transcriptional repressor MraZ [Candidatus Epulonipiscium sp.]
MFMGEYNHSIDPKGRFIVPAKFREQLGERFIVTKGLDGCLFVYPLEEWNLFEQKLKTLPLTSRDARKFTRFFFAGAVECEVDKQGRILLPSNLREYAELSKEAILIGVSTRVEIWSKETWDAYNQEDDFDVSDLADKMEQLGI